MDENQNVRLSVDLVLPADTDLARVLDALHATIPDLIQYLQTVNVWADLEHAEQTACVQAIEEIAPHTSPIDRLYHFGLG
tara:strand:- start:223 stop:462 length:240 start_codon:yes stop_codon:yes gene_type:complete